MSVNEKMTAIANNIRQYTQSTDKLNLDQMAQGIHDVYTKGGEGQYNEGHSDGWQAGYKDGTYDGKRLGKQEQYDLFWDNVQENGKRRNYIYAFLGAIFNADNFYPKYDIIMEGAANNAFYSWNYYSVDKSVLNLKERLEECGVVLDTSKATNLTALFCYGRFTEIPTINCNGLTENSTQLFRRNFEYLIKIEKIITKETVTYTQWFQDDTALSEIRFDGIIGQDIDFSSCPLSRASIENIVEHLYPVKQSVTRTLTLKQSAVNAAFTTAEFEALKATQPNWNFSLV